MKNNPTVGERYNPAMKIYDQQEANVYFQALVAETICNGYSKKEAEKIEKENLAYYAAYYNHVTVARVERLFKCKHPVFGET